MSVPQSELGRCQKCGQKAYSFCLDCEMVICKECHKLI